MVPWCPNSGAGHHPSDHGLGDLPSTAGWALHLRFVDLYRPGGRGGDQESKVMDVGGSRSTDAVIVFCFLQNGWWWLRDDDDIIGIWGRETEVPAIKVEILEKQSFRVEKLEKGREAVGSWPTPNIYTYLYNIGGGSKPDSIHFPAILVWQKVARFWPLPHSHIASECPSYFDKELRMSRNLGWFSTLPRLIRAVIPYNENCLWYMYI